MKISNIFTVYNLINQTDWNRQNVVKYTSDKGHFKERAADDFVRDVFNDAFPIAYFFS